MLKLVVLSPPMRNLLRESKVAVGFTPWLSKCPIRYKWSFARRARVRRGSNPLINVLRTDPLKASLLNLSYYLWNILKTAEREGLISHEHLAGTKEISNNALDKLWKEMFPDVEVLNIISIDMKRLLAWLKTPPGAAMLKYIREQKNEEKMQEILQLTKKYDKID